MSRNYQFDAGRIVDRYFPFPMNRYRYRVLFRDVSFCSIDILYPLERAITLINYFALSLLLFSTVQFYFECYFLQYWYFVSAQTITLAMYFGVSWLEPRLKINDSASEWTEIKTGPPDEINVSPEALQHIWYEYNHGEL